MAPWSARTRPRYRRGLPYVVVNGNRSRFCVSLHRCKTMPPGGLHAISSHRATLLVAPRPDRRGGPASFALAPGSTA